jgi:glycosyltransferase involved in cell wall biosynthesis
MRVLLLNQTFYPDVAATAQHAHDLARYLVHEGHEVVVIASRSIYGQKGASLPRRETVDGIEIHRVGVSLFGKARILLRLVDFALFYLLATVKVFMIRRPDVVVPFTTPPMIGLVGWLLKLVKRVPYVYWIMDLYPDVLVACGVIGPNSTYARLLERVNNLCVRKSFRTVVLGRCMKQRLIDKGLAAEQVTTINVWGDVQEIAPPPEPPEQSPEQLAGAGLHLPGAGADLRRAVARLPGAGADLPGAGLQLPGEGNPYRAAWGLRGKFVVMYSGNFGIGHDVLTMCEAAERLKHREDIRFVFVGGGKRKGTVERFIAEHGLKNCQSHPYQPREKLGALLTLADLHLGSLIEPLCGVIVPSKTYGMMASGRPGIFIGPAASEAGRVLVENGCGEVIRIGDSAGLAQAIERLAGDERLAREMGRNAREAMEHRYDRRHACAAWEQLLREAAACPSCSAHRPTAV